MTLHLDLRDISWRVAAGELVTDTEDSPVFVRVPLSDDKSVALELDEQGSIWLRTSTGSALVRGISPALASWKAAEELEAEVLRYEVEKARGLHDS